MRLMPAWYVKPYVKTNKNDYIDAEACGEAVTRPNMRFVPIKTDDQLDLQSLHRIRERWVRGRTAVINQIRGLLLERGITVAKGRRHIEEALPGILEDPDNKLSGALRVLLIELRGRYSTCTDRSRNLTSLSCASPANGKIANSWWRSLESDRPSLRLPRPTVLHPYPDARFYATHPS